MRLLIAQGPGYYGVNIRLIDEATYERALAKPEYDWKPDIEGEGDFSYVMCQTKDANPTTLVMTGDIDATERRGEITSFSEGFDTGWWEQGEAIIKEVLK